MDPFLIITAILVFAPVLITIKLTIALCQQVHWVHFLIPVLHTAALALFTYSAIKRPSNTGDATPGVFFAYLIIVCIIHGIVIIPTAIFSHLATSGIYTTAAFYKLIKIVFIAVPSIILILIFLGASITFYKDITLWRQHRKDIKTSIEHQGKTVQSYFGSYCINVPKNISGTMYVHTINSGYFRLYGLPRGTKRESFFKEDENTKTLKKRTETIGQGTLETLMQFHNPPYLVYEKPKPNTTVSVNGFYTHPRYSLAMRGITGCRYGDDIRKWHTKYKNMLSGYNHERDISTPQRGQAFLFLQGMYNLEKIKDTWLENGLAFEGGGIKGTVSWRPHEEQGTVKTLLLWALMRAAYNWTEKFFSSHEKPRTYMRDRCLTLADIRGHETLYREIDDFNNSDSIVCRWHGYDRRYSRGISVELRSDFTNLKKTIPYWHEMLKTFTRAGE